MPTKPAYPPAPRLDVVDDYHGTKIADPFRRLEDPDHVDTRAWIEAENRVTDAWLDRSPTRAALKARLTELWNYERYGVPFFEGRGADRRLYFFKNDGLQNQAVLFVVDAVDGRLDADGAARVLLDPNALSPDGTVSLAGLSFTDDGTRMAYALSHAGSDWQEWRVKDVRSGVDLPDVVRWSKFSGASFAHDGSGFFYARYPEPDGAEAASTTENFFHKVYFHTLGEPQQRDVLVVEDAEHKTWGFDARVTEDGAWLVIQVWDGTDRRTRVWLKDLRRAPRGDGPLLKLLDELDAAYHVIGAVGSTLYVVTDNAAPRQRLVRVDVDAVKPTLTTLIPEHASDKLDSASMIGGGFVVRWLRMARDVVTQHDRSGALLREVSLPTIGTTSGFAGRSDDTLTYYAFTSFTYPTVIYALDLARGSTTLWRSPRVAFSPDDFETRQVRYRSRDGTEVPMFLVHKKGLALDGTAPTYLYGYGGFNISMSPAFSVPLVVWLERGGVFAQPALRGGGELGEDWHQAGMLDRKQNVFDDFAAAARYLVDAGITSPARLAIGGGSNGGLLVGASLVQNPELFGAAVAQVGVLDMLRFHKFTIGHAWVAEYGSADDAHMFPVLLRYSPLHNLRRGAAYPATLIMTADHDDRVVPAHSFKFAAALQEAQAGDAPILIRIDTKAGHGAGKPTAKLIEEAADKWAFLVDVLDG